MNTPIPSGTGRIAHEQRQVRQALRAQLPIIQTPDVLTSFTVAGTIQRPKPKPSAGASAGGDQIPRWG